MPTDTVYGIHGVAPETMHELRALKGRDGRKPFLLLMPDLAAVERYLSAEVPRDLAQGWPGALTLVLAAPAGGTVAIRVPRPPWLRAVLRDVERPLFSTSANPPGVAPARSGREVAAWFGRRIDLIVDDGVVGYSPPSTLVDATVSPPRVLRHGAIAVGPFGNGR